jgi:hypothetical protein
MAPLLIQNIKGFKCNSDITSPFIVSQKNRLQWEPAINIAERTTCRLLVFKSCITKGADI